ncbi:MAG: DUF4234 domain-containing protein [Sandaracinaceae bacterium]
MGPKGEVRNVFMMALLWVVTFGIYAIWWSFKVAGEVNAFLGTERMSAIKIMAFTFLSCGLYGLYFQFVEAKNILKEVQAKAGQPQETPFVVNPISFQRTLNKVWESA